MQEPIAPAELGLNVPQMATGTAVSPASARQRRSGRLRRSEAAKGPRCYCSPRAWGDRSTTAASGPEPSPRRMPASGLRRNGRGSTDGVGAVVLSGRPLTRELLPTRRPSRHRAVAGPEARTSAGELIQRYRSSSVASITAAGRTGRTGSFGLGAPPSAARRATFIEANKRQSAAQTGGECSDVEAGAPHPTTHR